MRVYMWPDANSKTEDRESSKGAKSLLRRGASGQPVTWANHGARI